MAAVQPPKQLPKPPRGAWRTEIGLRVSELRDRLLAAQAQAKAQESTGRHVSAAGGGAGGEGPAGASHRAQVKTASALVTVEVKETPAAPAALPSEVRDARVAAIQGAIARAEQAISDAPLLERLADWWTGSSITAGWESVHGAEAELVDIESEGDVRAALPHLANWLGQVMPAGEPRKRYETELEESLDATKPLDRTTVRLIYKDVVRANNESKANLRAFRNLLTVLTGVLALALALIAVWHAIEPHFVSLCGAGSKTQAAACLDGGGHTHGADVFLVELLGALGGLLSLAVAFSGTEAPPSRYNVRPQQAALKVVAGAATGLIGVLIVQSGIIVSPASQTASEALFLVYAAAFGFSQQLFTRFVDKRAEALLGEGEEKPAAGSSAAKAAGAGGSAGAAKA